MGRDKRKRDRRQTADVDNANNNAEINTTTVAQMPLEPRAQREPRNKPGQERREVVVKKVAPVTEQPAAEHLSEKKEETKEASPDPTVLFANLKRETDDIKALTEKKFSKRQIFSNWSRYDEPLPGLVQEEELPGADFKALCANLTSESNYFQLKSERSWDANVSALSSELFSLNADILAVGLGCIPFYERLDLPITLFSEADIQKMKSSAKIFKSQYESSKSYFHKKLNNLNTLRERSNAEDNLPLKAEREKTPDHKPTLSFSIDRPETPDEFERGILTEVCEQAHNIPPKPTFSADIARKGSPGIVSKATSKIPETNTTPQHFRTNSSILENGESDLQEFKENTARDMSEISFNAISQRKEINTSPKCFVEDRSSPELLEKVEPPGKKIFEEINGDNPEKLNMRFQRHSMSPETEKIKHFDIETNDAILEMSGIVVQQSELVPEKVVEETTPEPFPEILPPRQMNKSKSKEKRKRHILEMGSASGTTTDSEAASPQIQSELKSETETVPNIAVNEDMRSQEEVLKPLASVESLGQRSKKRKPKEKGQFANKLIENAKMPTQENPKVTNTLAEEKPKPVAKEIAVEKAKSPSPEKPSVKPYSAPQTKPSEIVKSKQEKVAEPVKAVQKKPLEIVTLKEEKPVQKVILKKEKPIEKVKPREEKVKAPAQEKTVEKIKEEEEEEDDLDFLLSLRRPIREPQVTPGASTQASKSSIEEDDTPAKPTALKFLEETEDLEDWLDSVLGD